MWGEICHQAGHELGQPESLDFMAKLISRVMPKSYYQAWYEVKVTADFLKNFGGTTLASWQVVSMCLEITLAKSHATTAGHSALWPLFLLSISPWKSPLCS